MFLTFIHMFLELCCNWTTFPCVSLQTTCFHPLKLSFSSFVSVYAFILVFLVNFLKR